MSTYAATRSRPLGIDRRRAALESVAPEALYSLGEPHEWAHVLEQLRQAIMGGRPDPVTRAHPGVAKE